MFDSFFFYVFFFFFLTYVCFLTGTTEAVIKSSLTIIIPIPKYAEHAGKKKEMTYEFKKTPIKIHELFFLQCEQKNIFFIQTVSSKLYCFTSRHFY